MFLLLPAGVRDAGAFSDGRPRLIRSLLVTVCTKATEHAGLLTAVTQVTFVLKHGSSMSCYMPVVLQ
jgi:hypothetical protein